MTNDARQALAGPAADGVHPARLLSDGAADSRCGIGAAVQEKLVNFSRQYSRLVVSGRTRRNA